MLIRRPLPILLLFVIALPCLKSESYFVNDLGAIFKSAEPLKASLRSNQAKELPSILNAYNRLKSNPLAVNLDQFILFSVGDKENYKGSFEDSSYFRQDLNQTTVNYCDFDPNRLSSKLKPTAPSSVPKYQSSDPFNVKQNVDIIVKRPIFNTSSEISIRIQFLNKQAESQQLWYLLEAKSVCTNKVVGTWQLSQQANTETIFCFNRDDTVFGHRSDKSVTIFDQVWIATDTNEDIYFVLAVFTDEAYTLTSPYYSIISSPIIKYETYSLINDYKIKCAMPTLTNKQVDTFQFETVDAMTSTVEAEAPEQEAPSNIPRLEPPEETTPDLETTETVVQQPSTTRSNPEQVASQSTGTSQVSSTVFSTLTTSSGLTVKPIGSDYNVDRSMLINLVGEISGCWDLNQNLALTVKKELEIIYRNVSNFKEVQVTRITSKSCSQSVKSKTKRKLESRATTAPIVTVEHYCLFKSPVTNRTKMNLVDNLQGFLSSSQQMGNLRASEAFVLKDDGTRVNLNDSCTVYDYLKLCQNNGICSIQDSTPTCVCIPKMANESFYWSGDYCDYKTFSPSESDQIKMIVTVATLGTFAIASLVALILYIIYKRRKQKEIIKRSINSTLKCISIGKYIAPSTTTSSHSLFTKTSQRSIMTISNSISKDNSSSCLTNDTSVSSFTSNGVFSYTQVFEDQTDNEYKTVDIQPGLSSTKVYEKRHSFSVRNTLSSRSSDSFSSYLEANQFNVVNKQRSVVCVTDGASASFKPIEPGSTSSSFISYDFKPKIVNIRQNNTSHLMSRADVLTRQNFSANCPHNHTTSDNNISKLLSEKSKISFKNNLASPNYIDYPRINGFADPNLRTIAYPKDVIIASPPKSQFQNPFKQQNAKESKKKSKESKKESKKSKTNNTRHQQQAQAVMAMDTRNNNMSHVNYAYDNDKTYDLIASENNIHTHSQDDLFQKNSQTCSEEFLIQSQYHNNQLKLGRKESAQHIPHSFEKHMVKNFQNLTTNSSPTGTYSLDTSIETTNQNSKYTDSTSICTDTHSLKDEDAWLPILNIAEEEILKYQAQEASKITEYCLI